MKKISLLFALICSMIVSAQETDYRLARAGESVLGVYFFVHCEPVQPFDYVGKIDYFDVHNTSSKDMEKILQKAKKKNPQFDAIIVKKDYNHIELVKFKARVMSIAGFSVGDKVQYESFGRIIKGEIIELVSHKERAVVKYTDPEGNDKLDGVAIKSLIKTVE